MRVIAICTALICGIIASMAQPSRIFSKQIRTLQVMVNNDPLLPPIMNLGGRNHVCISFDDLSHEYHRYIYKIEHCNADWTPSTEVFESDYMDGFNLMPIENYEKSFNTTLLYTHYALSIPNENVSLRISGNYRVSVFCDDEGASPEPVLQACFSVVEPQMGISAKISSNTDIDFNREHQQVSFSLNYGNYHVADPHRELRTVIMQNRRTDNCVINPRPNIQRPQSIEFTHNRQLIFEGGNECRKFEILDVHAPAMNVDRMEWFDPFYHATLYEDEAIRNYVYDEDQNGVAVIRNEDNEDNATASEYLFVHFTLKRPQLPGGDVYINGTWTHSFSPEYRMTYNPQREAYEATLLLKQGYYNYRYLFVHDGESRGNSTPTDGNFYQTENEYIILVYHRPAGGRYDKLVGYKRMNFTAS